jgi:hypothetical protein
MTLAQTIYEPKRPPLAEHHLVKRRDSGLQKSLGVTGTMKRKYRFSGMLTANAFFRTLHPVCIDEWATEHISCELREKTGYQSSCYAMGRQWCDKGQATCPWAKGKGAIREGEREWHNDLVQKLQHNSRSAACMMHEKWCQSSFHNLHGACHLNTASVGSGQTSLMGTCFSPFTDAEL